MKICNQVFIPHLSTAWQESNQEREIQGTELQFSLQQAILKKLLLAICSQWCGGFVVRPGCTEAAPAQEKHAQREKYF